MAKHGKHIQWLGANSIRGPGAEATEVSPRFIRSTCRTWILVCPRMPLLYTIQLLGAHDYKLAFLRRMDRTSSQLPF